MSPRCCLRRPLEWSWGEQGRACFTLLFPSSPAPVPCNFPAVFPAPAEGRTENQQWCKSIWRRCHLTFFYFFVCQKLVFFGYSTRMSVPEKGGDTNLQLLLLHHYCCSVLLAVGARAGAGGGKGQGIVLTCYASAIQS